MIDATTYNIIIRKGVFEGETCFEARVTELPDVAEYADSYEEAYALAIDTIEITAQALSEQGKEMPLPIIPVDDYSGRVTLRLPKTLHKSLATFADQEGVSLNQHLVSLLSYFSGYANARESHTLNVQWYTPEIVSSSKSVKKNRLTIVKTSSASNDERIYASR